VFCERLPTCNAGRAVLAAICNLSARNRNRCDAAINTIAEMAGVSRSSVNQALRLLEALKLIRSTPADFVE
jgi:Mn-dependent DtxR family transcriptional regulator